MTLREIRLKAAEILEASEDSWCQKIYRHKLPDGRYAYCMFGACQEAIGYFMIHDAGLKAGWSMEEARAACKIRESADVAARAIMPGGMLWNDAPGRTREEVIAALRAVKEGD